MKTMNARPWSPMSVCGWHVAGLTLCLRLFLFSGGILAAEKGRTHSAQDEASGKASRGRSVGQGTRSSLDAALKYAETSRQALQEVQDYTAEFSKVERIDNRVIEGSMDLKFREKPFSVKLRCRSKPDAGREVIYVAGENDGKLIVRESGLKSIIGAIELAPDDPKVREENRRPITEIGMLQMLDLETALWRADRDSDPANVEVTSFSGVKVGDLECDGFELKHLKHKSKEQFALTRIYFDSQTKFPVQVEHFNGAGTNDSELALVEKYTYTDIKTNVGLGESDFDRHNSGKRRN
jgi:Protein of unknown function (DUF1571)